MDAGRMRMAKNDKEGRVRMGDGICGEKCWRVRNELWS